MEKLKRLERQYADTESINGNSPDEAEATPRASSSQSHPKPKKTCAKHELPKSRAQASADKRTKTAPQTAPPSLGSRPLAGTEPQRPLNAKHSQALPYQGWAETLTQQKLEILRKQDEIRQQKQAEEHADRSLQIFMARGENTKVTSLSRLQPEHKPKAKSRCRS